MTYTGRTLSSSKTPLKLDLQPLGKGGEGAVYSVVQHSIPNILPANELVAKLYYKPEEGDRAHKIEAMLESPPDSDSVAWPLAIVEDEKGFAGYLMQKLPSGTYRPWSSLAHVKSRRETSEAFDVRYAITACENLGIAIQSVHNAGHCLGDINESNALVSNDARVMIVDTDSAQIKSSSGEIFPCPVGKPEFTASELTHGNLRDQRRSKQSDIFAYSVMMFQMLTGGAHPTDAKYSGNDDPPNVVNKIRNGIFPGILSTTPKEFTVVPRIPVGGIPKVYKNIFKKGLLPKGSERPYLDTILKAEAGVRKNLVQCKNIKSHWYDQREQQCSWCVDRAKVGGMDPWAPPGTAPKLSQNSLPQVSFNDSDSQPTIRRAPINSQTPSKRAAQRAISNPVTTPYQSQSYSPNSGPMQLQPYPQGNSSTQAPGLPPGFSSNSQGQQSSLAPPGPSQNSQPQQNIPNKIKGKSVLVSPDGSYRVRPPLGTLFFQNPKLAISCFFDEIPKPAQFWWSRERKIPGYGFLTLGFILGLVLSGSWAFLIPLIRNQISAISQDPTALAGFLIIGITAAATSVIAMITLFITGILRHYRVAKTLGPNEVIVKGNPALVVLHFITVSIFCGPLLVVLIAFGIIMLILSAVLNILKYTLIPRRNYRR